MTTGTPFAKVQARLSSLIRCSSCGGAMSAWGQSLPSHSALVQINVCFPTSCDRLSEITKASLRPISDIPRSSGDRLVEGDLCAGGAPQKTFEVKACEVISRILAHVRGESR
jgi:hypothetical protein